MNNVYFAELSADAKLLYAFFLDRVSLSIKNGWMAYIKALQKLEQMESIVED